MTGTDVLIKAMEEFGNSEPTAVMVVFSSQNGDMDILSNCSQLTTIGLAEYAKDRCLRQLGARSQQA